MRAIGGVEEKGHEQRDGKVDGKYARIGSVEFRSVFEAPRPRGMDHCCNGPIGQTDTPKEQCRQDRQ